MPETNRSSSYYNWVHCVRKECSSGKSCRKIRIICGAKACKYNIFGFKIFCRWVENICTRSTCTNRRLMTSANRSLMDGDVDKSLSQLEKARVNAEENDDNNQLLEISSIKLNIYMNYLKDREKAIEELNVVRDYTKRLEAELRSSDPRRNGTEGGDPPEVD